MPRSKLERYLGALLREALPGCTILENDRPEWLYQMTGLRLELDFYLPELSVAIEVQGEQHYRWVSFFQSSYSDFQKRLAYDQEKRQACERYQVRLHEIDDAGSGLLLVDELRKEWSESRRPLILSLSPRQQEKFRARNRRRGRDRQYYRIWTSEKSEPHQVSKYVFQEAIERRFAVPISRYEAVTSPDFYVEIVTPKVKVRFIRRSLRDNVIPEPSPTKSETQQGHPADSFLR